MTWFKYHRSPSLTAGRTLWNCAEKQWTYFAEPSQTPPARGKLEEVLVFFKCQIKPFEKGYCVFTEFGEPVSSSHPNPRRALLAWWFELGRERVQQYRNDKKDHLTFVNKYRQEAVFSFRTEARHNNITMLKKVYGQVEDVLRDYCPEAEHWLRQVQDVKMLHSGANQRCSETRLLVEAVCALFDAFGFWPEYSKALECGELDKEVLDSQIKDWVLKTGQRRNTIYCCILTAVNIALQTSQFHGKGPEKFIEKMRKILQDSEAQTPIMLARIGESILT